MKNYNKKINSFVEWCDENDSVIPSPTLFEQYQWENENIESLTEDEKKYLMILYKNKIVHQGIVGRAKSDMAKFVLSNEFGWGDKNIVSNEIVNFVKFDTSDLETQNTSALNHINESLENEAILNISPKSHGGKN